MSGMDIRLNGTVIKQPKKPSISHFNLTKAERVASGLMTMELIAKKKKLTLDYESISGKQMDQILNIIDGNAMFFTVSYLDNGVRKSFTAYAGEIPRKLSRAGTKSGWYWTDVSFSLIER